MNTIHHRAYLRSATALFFVVTLGLGPSTAFAAISSPMDFGSTGTRVTELQRYLATSSSIYPEALITGFFGPLTRAAVQRFQSTQGIVSSGTAASTGYGRVGPITAERINALLGSGTVSRESVPVMSSPSVQFTSTTANFTWSTNKATTGQVYWNTQPIIADEATGPNQTPFVSGTLALDAGGLQTNHTVTVSNLQTNTTYYYLVRVIDSSGNITMMWPFGSFHTSN